ncbi:MULTISPECIES: hypothetical protein [Enterococcus]|uniref:hypothetical protein n=1 Tax=Enterococcus TaxID=1350 RepID=UPI00065DC146|nr:MULTISPECIES: hypothetical protein [Enterococcus]KAF1302813.1 hypothetical protein BAU16_05970 [Enterococcus sp. JM9B]
MSKIIQGNFPNLEAAEVVAEKLIASGYPKESISLIVDKQFLPEIQKKTALRVETSFTVEADDAEDSLWERIKDFFDGDQDTFKEKIKDYQIELAKGNILVAYDEELVDNAPTTIPTIDEQDLKETHAEETADLVNKEVKNTEIPPTNIPERETKIVPDLTKSKGPDHQIHE